MSNVPSWQNAVKTQWRVSFGHRAPAMEVITQIYAIDDHRKHMPVFMGVIIVRAVLILN